MRLRFRPWQLAVGLILICCAVLSVVLLVRRATPPSAADLAASLPEAPGALFYMDVKGLRDSGVLNRILGKTLTEEAEYRDFVAQSGFDYKTDLDQILGKLTSGPKYFLLTGRFDWKALMKYAESRGGSCRNGFCEVQGSQPTRMISFYPMRPNVMALAVGPDAGAAYAIERRNATTGAAPLPSQPVWFMVPGQVLGDYRTETPGTRPFVRALANASNVVLSLGPKEDRFEAALDVTCRNAEDAAIMRAQLEGLTTELRKMIQLEKQTPNSSDLSGVLTSGTFERNGLNVTGRWPIEYAFLDSLSQ